jgi:hypothetical protein
MKNCIFQRKNISKIGDKIKENSGNNDFVSAGSAIGNVTKFTKPKPVISRLHKNERKITKLGSKMRKNSTKLHVKQSNLKSKKTNINLAGKRYKTRKQLIKSKFSATLNAVKNPDATIKKRDSTKEC